jgi:hypothetical protein
MGFIHLKIEWNPWLGGYRPQIPFSLPSVLNWNCWTPPPPKKNPGYATEDSAPRRISVLKSAPRRKKHGKYWSTVLEHKGCWILFSCNRCWSWCSHIANTNFCCTTDVAHPSKLFFLVCSQISRVTENVLEGICAVLEFLRSVVW